MFLSVMLDLFDDMKSINKLIEIMKNVLDVDFTVSKVPTIKQGISSTSIQIKIESDFKQKQATEVSLQ